MKVIVYGTLKRGYFNHRVISMAEGNFIKEVTVHNVSMYSYGPYPVALLDEPCQIKGELFEVKNIGPLDRLEGYPDFYDRSQVATTEGDMAWIYHAPSAKKQYIKQNLQHIEAGIWK